MNERVSFGKKLLGKKVDTVLGLEEKAGKGEQFAKADTLLHAIVSQSLRGRSIIEVKRGRSTSLESLYVPRKFERFVEETYALEKQQERGAWFLPEEATIRGGFMNLPYLFKKHGQYAPNVAWEYSDRLSGKVSLKDSPSSVLCWCLLGPFYEDLTRPIMLRTKRGPAMPKAKQVEQWNRVDWFLNSTGLPESTLSLLRPGSGWSKLLAGERSKFLQDYLSAVGQDYSLQTIQRYRVAQILALAGAYYAKAKDGTVTRRRVITKELAKPLSAYFGGDWIAFLKYLGEKPDPNEEIATSLPETKLYARGTARIQEIAEKKGLPPEEVEKMLMAYWKGSGGISPIEKRVATLKRYWLEFDKIHRMQKSGNQSLWGLVDERFVDLLNTESPAAPHRELYKDLLSAALQNDIEDLWGTVVILRWPDRLLSEPYPHAMMAEVFGPALKLWHGIALTAWFLCEGPYSRTDMAGLEEYHSRELAALEEMGYPTDRKMFQELTEAEKHLPTAEPMVDSTSESEVAPGLTVTMSMSSGSKRKGFEKLRDIVTSYRTAWADKYLLKYLDSRWGTELRAAGREYSRFSVDKGKQPTLRQFAKYAIAPANHWFAGDMSALFGSIGHKSPTKPTKHLLLPHDRVGFARTVFNELNFDQQKQPHASWLAQKSFWYVQLKEGKGAPPTLKEFGESAFESSKASLDEDVDKAYEKYTQVVERALTMPTTPPLPSKRRQRVDSPEVTATPKKGWLDRLLGK